jgi:hypothetical protein
VRQERLDLRSAHVAWMAALVEDDETTDPGEVGTLGPQAVMALAQVLADDFRQAAWTAVRVPGSGKPLPGIIGEDRVRYSISAQRVCVTHHVQPRGLRRQSENGSFPLGIRCVGQGRGGILPK